MIKEYKESFIAKVDRLSILDWYDKILKIQGFCFFYKRVLLQKRKRKKKEKEEERKGKTSSHSRLWFILVLNFMIFHYFCLFMSLYFLLSLSFKDFLNIFLFVCCFLILFCFVDFSFW